MPVVVADSLAGLIREEHYVLVGRWAASMYPRTRGFDESLRGFSLPQPLQPHFHVPWENQKGC